ncbi:heme-binding protein [Mesorhizobium sp. M0478]|uniref:GlcG/HbpS family heme-binding protein n=1 Tax=Mesorhizobium sp. M0478 TaxID=2956947 RepID=UPI003338B067
MDLLTKAKSLAERVEAEATKANVPVAVCIIDVHGNLVLQHRMSGAPVFALEISERKAYTSALVRLRTADILPLVQPGQSLYALTTVAGGRFCPMGGGIPLVDEDGKVYAGVGVSGGTAEEDVAIAEAAVR